MVACMAGWGLGVGGCLLFAPSPTERTLCVLHFCLFILSLWTVRDVLDQVG